jgi:hypothetical protein
MIRWLRCSAITAIAICALASSAGFASAATSSQQATVQGLVGNWTCITHESDNKTFRESDIDTMYGNWIRVNSSYPAQNGQPAGTGATFLGYDARNKRWIVTGVGTEGSYFTAYSNSPNYDGSKWVDAYPNDHGTALVHVISSTQYSLDTTNPGAQGKTVTAHTVCTRH